MYRENGNKVVNFRKDGRYSFSLKEKIYKEYQEGLSIVDLSCKYKIGISTIHRWIDNFRNNRYNIFMKKKIDNKNTVLKIEEKGSPNQKSKHKYTIEELEKINKDLEKRIRKLELENQYIKKTEGLNSKGPKRTKQIVEIIHELRRDNNDLNTLLNISNIKKSTFYYAYKQLMSGVDKDEELKIKILDLFVKNHKKYGYFANNSCFAE